MTNWALKHEQAENDKLRPEIRELRATLDKLARLGNEPDFGNSIAKKALGDIPSTKNHAND